MKRRLLVYEHDRLKQLRKNNLETKVKAKFLVADPRKQNPSLTTHVIAEVEKSIKKAG